MRSSGHLKISARGQMSLPSLARKRWELQHGGAVTYLDLADVIVIVPYGLASHFPSRTMVLMIATRQGDQHGDRSVAAAAILRALAGAERSITVGRPDPQTAPRARSVR